MTSPSNPRFMLYTYWRSSAAYRVRIALNLKSIPYESEFINLKAGEQRGVDFSEINPASLIPVLECQETGMRLTQSLAIMEYLETLFPDAPLLPENPVVAAEARAFAYQVCCDIHPIQNLRVLKYLKHEASLTSEEANDWAKYWISQGLNPLEGIAQKSDREFLFGNIPGIAECALIPQLYNAERFGVDLSEYPVLNEVNDNCKKLAAFVDAAPKNQQDSLREY